MPRYLFVLFLLAFLVACATEPEISQIDVAEQVASDAALSTITIEPIASQVIPNLPAETPSSYPPPPTPTNTPTSEFSRDAFLAYPPPEWTPDATQNSIEICNLTTLAPPSNIASSNPLAISTTQTVLTDLNEPQIIDWFPDSEQVVIMSLDNAQNRVVEIVSTATNSRTVHELMPSYPNIASWLPTKEDIVAYELRQEDTGGFNPVPVMGENRQTLVNNNISPVNILNNGFLSYFSDGGSVTEFNLYDADTDTITSFEIDPLAFYPSLHPDVFRINPNYRPLNYRASWSEISNQLLLFQAPYTFLFDGVTNSSCQLDLGNSGSGEIIQTSGAKWSANGRYAALFVSPNFLQIENYFLRLVILDTIENTLQSIYFNSLDRVSDIAWSPDSSYLAVLAHVEETEQWGSRQNLYFVDLENNSYQAIEPESFFGRNDSIGQLAWSPNGQKIAAICADYNQSTVSYNLCVLLVQ